MVEHVRGGGGDRQQQQATKTRMGGSRGGLRSGVDPQRDALSLVDEGRIAAHHAAGNARVDDGRKLGDRPVGEPRDFRELRSIGIRLRS